MIDFDALRMRRVMAEDDIGAGIDQVVGKCAVLRADLGRARSGPMDGNQDVVDLRPQLADVLLDQERIHRNDAGPSVRRECRFAEIVELRVAEETELDAVARDDHGLARIGKIVSAADMANPGQIKSAQRVEKPALFRVEGMIVGEIDQTDSRLPHPDCELLRCLVQAQPGGRDRIARPRY